MEGQILARLAAPSSAPQTIERDGMQYLLLSSSIVSAEMLFILVTTVASRRIRMSKSALRLCKASHLHIRKPKEHDIPVLERRQTAEGAPVSLAVHTVVLDIIRVIGLEARQGEKKQNKR